MTTHKATGNMKPRIFSNFNRFDKFINSSFRDYSSLNFCGFIHLGRIHYLEMTNSSSGTHTFNFMKIGILGFHNRKGIIEFKDGFVRGKFGNIIPAQGIAPSASTTDQSPV
jgi:hypothetical protein